VGVTKREETHDPSIATSRAEAQKLADQMLHDAWANRETASLIVRPGLISLEPGDIVALDAIGHPGDFRITRITDSGQRSIEAQSLDTIALDLSAGSAILPSTNAPHQPGQAVVITVDLPLVNGDTPVLQAFAAMADPWPGSLAVWRSGDGVDWTRFGTITRPATSGVTTTSLGAGPLWRWDLQNSVTTALDSGVLSAPGDLAALAGTVPLGLQGPDGTWEVIGFSNADLIAPNTWRLSRLLRGLGGSESSASRSLASGARVVVLDDALLPIATGPSSLGANASWRIVAAALDYMHPTAVALQTIAGGAALRPLSPVRAAAQRGVSGVTISFVRRARINADSWDPAEIPLDETLERYEIDILKNGLVIRTLPTSGSPSVLYPSVQESADFGSPQASLSVVIYQISDSVGRGFPYPVTLTGL